MKSPVAALMAALLGSASAHAAVDPQKVPKGDSHIRTTLYDTRQPVRLVSKGLQPLHLVLEEGEIPKAVDGINVYFIHPTDDGKEPDRSLWSAIRWEVRRSKNVLALQPFGMMQPTLMFIRSEATNGQTRHYATILQTEDGNALEDADAYYEVDWTYKHVPTPDEIAAWQARHEGQLSSVAERKARVLLEQAMTAPQLVNRDYWKDPIEDEHRKCSDLFPQDMYDNGHDTTMIFPPHAVLPVIAVLNQDGKRADVTPQPETTQEGVRVVLPATYKELRLYRGGKVCGVQNHGWDKTGTMLGGGTGTISPDVVRTVRGAR